uniref:Protein kinase domain-containing protein n=1 Tax=Corethron hystrix TaxID=216773 RepID=A0A7S1BTN4_9STRA|mmetsp:Transcript_39572/g.92533  ORF Transcript_39572/g.92533 Transcript_39572/m.92533 type:complete len:403 (+) Transcript_39572:182-1390(+)|eukprot:CAMPEP_0113314970 /NCGR_PEP_ID=MMETSP0010_2-20120614/10819_1 /TAXON_ID=216773 ORGANISM="Corethron hystrix, Strain 308" /NCGR_SAMPLE_ID=MMETSP0010_2 /ASSEMBLY_ACC=CAM_ASM_000155 /LENGTH=402 /DNA_ID=CAMNT_0000171365 /DNA_START=149 /DNA_END=1357 /DNA_ORIENTATION=+ /assembly_acc=CAM_ASM_000155
MHQHGNGGKERESHPRNLSRRPIITGVAIAVTLSIIVSLIASFRTTQKINFAWEAETVDNDNRDGGDYGKGGSDDVATYSDSLTHKTGNRRWKSGGRRSDRKNRKRVAFCCDRCAPDPRWWANFVFGVVPKYVGLENFEKSISSDDDEYDNVQNGFEQNDSSCIPVAGVEARSLSFPTCNSVHELGFDRDAFRTDISEQKAAAEGNDYRSRNIQFLGNGNWRDVWRVKNVMRMTEDDKEFVVLKMLRYKRRHERISFNKHRIDSLVMEELTGSPFVTDIHSFCGNSVVNEFGMISSSNLRDGYVSVTDRLYLAAQAATGVADLHGIVLDGGNKTHLEFVVEEHQRSAALVHLDIKPGNFIVTGKRIMKVHDFNLARFLEKNVTSGNLCFMKRSDCGIVSYSL